MRLAFTGSNSPSWLESKRPTAKPWQSVVAAEGEFGFLVAHGESLHARVARHEIAECNAVVVRPEDPLHAADAARPGRAITESSLNSLAGLARPWSRRVCAPASPSADSPCNTSTIRDVALGEVHAQRGWRDHRFAVALDRVVDPPRCRPAPASRRCAYPANGRWQAVPSAATQARRTTRRAPRASYVSRIPPEEPRREQYPICMINSESSYALSVPASPRARRRPCAVSAGEFYSPPNQGRYSTEAT